LSPTRQQNSDPGSTQLFGSLSARKTDARVEVLGHLDELVSTIGVARSHIGDEATNKLLRLIQSRLLAIGAAVADPDSRHKVIVTAQEAVALMRATDVLSQRLPKLTNFILAGGDSGATALHLARSVCRRAERSSHALNSVDDVPKPILDFLNRLSTFLFHVARQQSIKTGHPDDVWTPSDPLTEDDLNLTAP